MSDHQTSSTAGRTASTSSSRRTTRSTTTIHLMMGLLLGDNSLMEDVRAVASEA